MSGRNVNKRKAKQNIIIENDACSESDDYTGVTFQRQALEIREPPEGFDPHSAPQDGEHYLMQMAYERKRIPAIVVKRPRKLNDEPTAQPDEPKDEAIVVPPFGLPTEQWKDIQVKDFQALRAKIVQMRSTLSIANYDQNLELPLTNEPQKWQTFCEQNPPVLSIMMRIRQRNLESLLEILADTLRQKTDGVDDDDDDDIDGDGDGAVQATNTTAPTTRAHDGELPVPDLMMDDKWLGQWLYAALACLQLPLEGHVHFSLRRIARLCVRQRERLRHDDTDEQKAIPYNLLICLIAQVFGQLDMKDFV